MVVDPIPEDMRFQRAWWRAERVAWVLMAAFVLAAVAGVFGSGPLSATHATGPDGLRLDYPRFARLGAQFEMVLHVPAGAGGPRTLRLAPTLAQGLQVDAVAPRPQVETGADGLAYRLLIKPGADTQVRLALHPRSAGLLRGPLAVDGAALPVWIWVYP